VRYDDHRSTTAEEGFVPGTRASERQNDLPARPIRRSAFAANARINSSWEFSPPAWPRSASPAPRPRWKSSKMADGTSRRFDLPDQQSQEMGFAAPVVPTSAIRSPRFRQEDFLKIRATLKGEREQRHIHFTARRIASGNNRRCSLTLSSCRSARRACC